MGELFSPAAPALVPLTLTPQIPVMVYLDPVAVVAEGVPWWVILLAVLAGLLVLALLVLLLWKVRLGEGGASGGWFPCQAGGLSFCGSVTHPLTHLFSRSALSTYLASTRDSVRPWALQRSQMQIWSAWI